MAVSLVYSFTRYEALPRNVTSEALPFDHDSQGREAQHSAAEPRNEENKVQATERGERCVESRNEEKQDGSITRLLVYSLRGSAS